MKLDVSQRYENIVNYYISNSGNVNNTGESLSAPTTFAGIENIVFDRPIQLNFNKNETFNQTLSISNNNVTISSYGSGTNPIFIGSYDASGLTWINEGDGTYSTVISEPDWVYINGEIAAISETAWITITSYPATNQLGFNAADISGYASIIGSRLTLNSRSWQTEYLYTVPAYNAGILTLNQATVYQTDIIGTRFKLLGKKDYPMLNNGWAYQDGKLYIKTAVNPALMDIRISNNRKGITVSADVDNITIKNLIFSDFYYTGVEKSNKGKITVEQCTMYNCGTGINIVGNNPTALIYNCTIHDCNAGIISRAANSIKVQGCTIYNIGVGYNIASVVDYSLSAGSCNKAIFCRDNESLGYNHESGDISYNTIYNIAYNGITTNGYCNIHHNIIHDFCTIFSDGGGIYSFSGSGYSNYKQHIYNNIIYNGILTFCCGVYVDNRTIAAEIHDNTIYKMIDSGININNDTQYTICKNNTIVDCTQSIRYRQLDDNNTSFAVNRANVVKNNIFALRSASQYCHYAYVADGTANYNPFTSGSSDNNYYISPYTTRIGYHTSDISMTFAEMQTRYSTDANSNARVNYKTYVNQTQAELDVLLFTNETAAPVVQAVGAGYIDVDGNSISEVTVPAYGGILVLKS